jgi:hypothetical protein
LPWLGCRGWCSPPTSLHRSWLLLSQSQSSLGCTGRRRSNTHPTRSQMATRQSEHHSFLPSTRTPPHGMLGAIFASLEAKQCVHAEEGTHVLTLTASSIACLLRTHGSYTTPCFVRRSSPSSTSHNTFNAAPNVTTVRHRAAAATSGSAADRKHNLATQAAAPAAPTTPPQARAAAAAAVRPPASPSRTSDAPPAASVAAAAPQSSTESAAVTDAAAASSSDAPDCPPGFDASIFASLPLEMQREAVRTAERRAKAERAAEDRKAKQAAKAARQAAAGAPSSSSSSTDEPVTDADASPAKSAAGAGETVVCGVVLPADCTAESLPAQMASFRLNALLAELRVGATRMAGHVDADDMQQL